MEILDTTIESALNPVLESEATDTCPEEAVLMQLSFNSFIGIDTPSTMRLQAYIGSSLVVGMLDSGASHNFISPDTVAKLKLPLVFSRHLHVVFGTGIEAKGLGICKDISFTLQGIVFKTTFIVLELGSADMILGGQWLRTLGDCQCNWETHTLSFQHHDQTITLQGDQILHKTCSSGHAQISPFILLSHDDELQVSPRLLPKLMPPPFHLLWLPFYIGSLTFLTNPRVSLLFVIWSIGSS